MAQDQQQDVIAFLSRPGSYGMTEPVGRVETHAAIVFLAGDRAFKLKRAVRYPYLDFSTAALRRAVCEEELRLNRRTAPEIYLAVRSVNRQADGSLGFGPGEPVDWLVEMRRFQPEDLLEEVAQRGELMPALMRRLADRIVHLHDIAEVVPGPGADRMRDAIAKNQSSLEAHPSVLEPDQTELFSARIRAELERMAPLLDARAKAGQVRHCHGDLHLANICLWHGEPTLFDALEFDSELATIDVLYDVAFLIMDLWERGLKECASIIFNRYCDMAGESDGLAALPLFLSFRAAIRAQVAATVAAQQGDKGAAKAREAREYLAAALAFLKQPAPRLAAIGGFSGTGKSTLAASLAPELGGGPGARWLRTDVLRKRMAGVAPEARLPPESYTKEQSAQVYARLEAETLEVLAAGRSVIVDGVFSLAAERHRMADLATRAGAPFIGLWLDAPLNVLKDRVSARRDDASDATADVVERQYGRDPGDLTGWHCLDASRPPEEVAQRARDRLDQAKKNLPARCRAERL